jgi:hypothetical protein
MNKQHFKQLALLGMAGGLLIASDASAEEKKSQTQTTKESPKNAASPDNPSYGNEGYHLMSDDDLKMELNDSGIKLYNSLDAKGKELARKVASQRCAGTNECKGLGSCANEKHSCIGKNDCRGQSVCGISDKNIAVKLVAEKMAQKRQTVTQD